MATNIDWQVSDNLYGSDHFRILININSQYNTTQTHILRWKLHRANWELYKEIITENIHNTEEIIELQFTNHKIDIDEILDSFNNNILNAANQSIPKTISGRI